MRPGRLLDRVHTYAGRQRQHRVENHDPALKTHLPGDIRCAFDASMASLRPRGMLALYGMASGPVPPMDTQRLNAAGSVFLTRPKLQDYVATREELTWRAGEVLDAVRQGSLRITISDRYPLADAARAHQDLQGRHTTGKLLLLPGR